MTQLRKIGHTIVKVYDTSYRDVLYAFLIHLVQSLPTSFYDPTEMAPELEVAAGFWDFKHRIDIEGCVARQNLETEKTRVNSIDVSEA